MIDIDYEQRDKQLVDNVDGETKGKKDDFQQSESKINQSQNRGVANTC
jgi:hypothetical protein